MMTDLVAILPPPATPMEAPSKEAWSSIERTFSKLPEDYKEFINTYGTGYICDGYLTVFSPFANNRYLNLMQQLEMISAGLSELASQFPKDYGFPLFPQSNGYLPFGMNNEGAYLFWATDGDPNSWTVTVLASDSPRFQQFRTNMVDWLEQILSGKSRCSFFAADLLDFPVNFRSS